MFEKIVVRDSCQVGSICFIFLEFECNVSILESLEFLCVYLLKDDTVNIDRLCDAMSNLQNPVGYLRAIFLPVALAVLLSLRVEE